jgi:hypothetical protein
MPHSTVTIELTPEEREALAAIMRTGRGRVDLAKRARIIVRLADGASYVDLIRLGKVRARSPSGSNGFSRDVAGLAGRYCGNTPTVLTPALEARILAWTRKPPANGATQVEHADAGGGAEPQHSHLCATRVKARRAAAPSDRATYAVYRSRL